MEETDASKKKINLEKQYIHLDASENDILVKIHICTQKYSTMKDPSLSFHTKGGKCISTFTNHVYQGMPVSKKKIVHCLQRTRIEVLV